MLEQKNRRKTTYLGTIDAKSHLMSENAGVLVTVNDQGRMTERENKTNDPRRFILVFQSVWLVLFFFGGGVHGVLPTKPPDE